MPAWQEFTPTTAHLQATHVQGNRQQPKQMVRTRRQHSIVDVRHYFKAALYSTSDPINVICIA